MRLDRDLITGSVAVLFIVLFFLGVGLRWSFRSILHRRHPEVWRDLGSPNFVAKRSAANMLRLERFLWGSKYGPLGDRQLSGVALALKTVILLYLLSFGLLIAAWWGGP